MGCLVCSGVDGQLKNHISPDGGLGSRGLFTPRLTLRWVAQSDAERLSVLGGDPLILQKTETIPHPYDMPAAHQWIDESEALRARGVAYRFAIEERASGDLIGVSALTGVNDGAAELGYWLGRTYWGQGFGREAVAATVAFGQDILKLRSLQAIVYSENVASVAVLRGQGFDEMAFETIDVPERGGNRLVRRFVCDLTDGAHRSTVVPLKGRVA